MQIISHRGYWKSDTEKNTAVAFEKSFSMGFGTETDLRDFLGELVLSHDVADASCISADDFFSLYNNFASSHLPLALNIKADGLHSHLLRLLDFYHIQKYFVFDMSIPDTVGYIKEGMRFYSRQSEYEPQPAFYEACAGVWLDAFTSTWFTNQLILDHVQMNKEVAIVSSELHRRDPLSLWEQLKMDNLHHVDNLILCTDRPEEARSFFNS